MKQVTGLLIDRNHSEMIPDGRWNVIITQVHKGYSIFKEDEWGGWEIICNAGGIK